MAPKTEPIKAVRLADNSPEIVGVFPEMAATLHNELVVLSTEFDHGMNRIRSSGDRLMRVMDAYEAKINAFADNLESQMEKNFKE